MANIIHGVEFKKVNQTASRLSYGGVIITLTPKCIKLNGAPVAVNSRLGSKLRKALSVGGLGTHAARRAERKLRKAIRLARKAS